MQPMTTDVMRHTSDGTRLPLLQKATKVIICTYSTSSEVALIRNWL